MNRHAYLAEVIRLYLDAPQTPSRARPADWAVAATFHRQAIPLTTIAHAIRIATLRRHLRPDDLEPLEPIHSLAYFRCVLEHLHPEDLESAYVDYVEYTYHARITRPSQDGRLEKNAVKKPDSRSF